MPVTKRNMADEVFDPDELNLENRVVRNALARRAAETINRAIFNPALISKKQSRELKKKRDIGREYARDFRASLKEALVRNYLSFLSMEEALAAVEAATLKVARDPSTTYEAEIPSVILRKEYFDFLGDTHSFSALARRGRIKLHQAGATIREIREAFLDAQIEAFEMYRPFTLRKYAK